MRRHGQAAEAALALGVVAVGMFFAVQTYALPEVAGYVQVGPRLFPALIALGLIVCGAGLAFEAMTGGFRKLPENAHPAIDWTAFVWVSAGVVAHMASIRWIGFIFASTLLFACVARGFGSARLMRDVLIGLALAVGAYVIFTRGLGLALPSGLPRGAG